ncbi:MAG: SDR family oxidoreductase [Myxococcota bacterium]|nr:SDR family oxidoreductase [Myxococcota bacterium]
MNEKKSALIIGFPRLLARALAVEGLHSKTVRTVYLLHSEHMTAAAETFRASPPAGIRKRLTLLSGDLSSVNLKLSGAEVRRLSSEVTHIIHADSDVTSPEKELRASLTALNQIFSLARDCQRLNRICIFSSAFVSGNRSGIVREEELDQGQLLRTVYEEAMMARERAARFVMPRLPITIFRPSAMVGRWKDDDHAGLTEGPTYLLSLMMKLPIDMPFVVPGSGFVPFNIVPVEYVVKAAWALAMEPSARGRTFHLTDPNPVSARQAFELLADRTNRPRPVSAAIATRLLRPVLRLPGLGRLLRNTVTVLDDLSQNVTYCCAGTLELLADTDIRCPPFDAYADTLVTWMAGIERRHRPTLDG